MADFFKDYKTVPDSVVLGQGPDGRTNGLGAVVFENVEEAERAA